MSKFSLQKHLGNESVRSLWQRRDALVKSLGLLSKRAGHVRTIWFNAIIDIKLPVERHWRNIEANRSLTQIIGNALWRVRFFLSFFMSLLKKSSYDFLDSFLLLDFFVNRSWNGLSFYAPISWFDLAIGTRSRNCKRIFRIKVSHLRASKRIRASLLMWMITSFPVLVVILVRLFLILFLLQVVFALWFRFHLRDNGIKVSALLIHIGEDHLLVELN